MEAVLAGVKRTGALQKPVSTGKTRLTAIIWWQLEDKIAPGQKTHGAAGQEIVQIGVLILEDGVIILISSQRIAGNIQLIQHAVLLQAAVGEQTNGRSPVVK